MNLIELKEIYLNFVEIPFAIRSTQLPLQMTAAQCLLDDPLPHYYLLWPQDQPTP